MTSATVTSTTLAAASTAAPTAASTAEPLPTPLPASSVDPTTQPPSAACLDNDLCAFIYHETGVGWLADMGLYLLVKPLRIAMLIIAALVARHLAHRLIRRLVRSSTGDDQAGLLQPLRERMPASLREATGLYSERRRQRAEALASVLRSAASVSIVTVAAMLILGEMGVQLAPLVASAGIIGVALGLGAQNLVKDFIAGLVMLLEDQYGVGDVIDVGDVSGTVEDVGLRITTIRDPAGTLWYVRNGEISRVGNSSQGWSLVVVDVPVTFANAAVADRVLRDAAAAFADDAQVAPDILEPPDVLGIEDIAAEGPKIRVTVRTTMDKREQLARELRRRLTEALAAAGVAVAEPAAEPPTVMLPDQRDGETPPMR